MGSWGPDSFENDHACDWAEDLTVQGLGLVNRTLHRVVAETDLLDMDVGAYGLAAADVVARLAGLFGQQDAYTEDVDVWVASQSAPPGAPLVQLAVAAIDRVLGAESELLEVWEDAEDPSWRICVLALRARLTGYGAAGPLYHDDSANASDPLDLQLDRARLSRIHPESWISRLLRRRRTDLEIIDEHLSFGDSRAASVVSVSPLRVAAYTDELDCAIVLEFTPEETARIAREFGPVSVGQRLITVNTYEAGGAPVSDLWNGPRSYHRYANFFPIIADFYVADSRPLQARVAQIDEWEWQRCRECAREYMSRNARRFRAGSPFASFIPV